MKRAAIGNILIPNIDKTIKKQLERLNLKPEISPRKFLLKHKTNKHRYFSPCRDKNKKVIGFYSILHNNEDARGKFIDEIKFLNKLKTNNFEIKKIVPGIIDYDINKNSAWFTRQYPLAPSLGHSRALVQKPFEGMHEQIVKAIFDISKIPVKNFMKLEKFRYQNYIAKEAYENLALKRIVSKDLSRKIQRMISKNISLARTQNKYFSHGDLNLGNILSDRKRIWIIDWELIHQNNFAYDIGYLWAHLWEAKISFRRKLMETYIKKLDKQKLSAFKKLLPLVASYLCLGGIVYKKGKEWQKKLEKRQIFYKRMLRNCLDFKKLIRT